MKTAAFALLALVAFTCVSSTMGQMNYCRRSAFKVPCKSLENAKKMWWKSCPGVAQASAFKSAPGGCCTVVQKTKSADSWEAYRKCEHATPLYNKAFKQNAAGCASLAAAGPCKGMM